MKKYSDIVSDERAAIVCSHIAAEGLPILLAIRDEPIEEVDSGWQFLCNSGQDEDEEEAQIWALSEVCEHTPSLKNILESQVKGKFYRKNEKSSWKSLKNAD
jgi:hypothetical protein